jgi:hypothetical protein
MAVVRGYRTIALIFKKEQVSVRASPRVADALEEISGGMDLYQGVKLAQILEAVYVQGTKDGARKVIEEFDARFDAIKKQIPHRQPGRPKKRKR